MPPGAEHGHGRRHDRDGQGADRPWLAETGYPLVAEIFKFYRANLREEPDGRLHIPLSSSPDYRENKPEAWCKDPNIDIALIRRCCDWVVEMEQTLGKDELGRSAREVRAKRVPYHLTKRKDLCLWADKPLAESHRHPSHLMAIHPAMDLTVEDGAASRAIINASLEQYFSLGQYGWAGHTKAGATRSACSPPCPSTGTTPSAGHSPGCDSGFQRREAGGVQ